MFKIQRHIAQLAICLFSSLLILGCSTRHSSYTTIEGEALGTFVQVKYSGEVDSDVVTNLIQEVDTEAKASLSIFDPTSLLSRINRNECDSLDKHIAFNLKLAGHFTKISNGAYDVTIKPLTEAWGFASKHNNNEVPNIDSLLEFVGYDKLSVENNRLIKSDKRTQLDFNSIAKGYTVDILAERLEALGIEDYMVNIGGEIRCLGKNFRGDVWSIGIETPYDGNMEGESLEKIIHIEDCAVATSGNYRRFYLNDKGEKIAHTLSPKSGKSVVSKLLSATVVAPTCAEADAAATMFMAMGSDGGALELARRCEEEYGWEFYFIYADGTDYKIECSERFRD